MEELYYTPSFTEPVNRIILKVNEIVRALNAMEAASTSTNISMVGEAPQIGEAPTSPAIRP